MKIAIINSTGFWSMGWTTDTVSQQDVIASLQRADIDVVVFTVEHKLQLDEVLRSLKSEPCLVWPNAYQIYAKPASKDEKHTESTREIVWLADVIAEHDLPIIGSSAQALQIMHAKDKCQHCLEDHGVPIPGFAAVYEDSLDNLAFVLTARQLDFPLFVKPNTLSTSKGISQKSVVHDLDELNQQIRNIGEAFGYPVMVEEFLPHQDITVAVFMTPNKPQILATYYDNAIYGDPGAALDHEVRMRDWNDGKWLRVVSEPEILAQIEAVVLPACRAVGIGEFTRIDCRFDAGGATHGELKAFDVNGMPGLELPFSTSVWQMIVKMQHFPELHAYDTLIALIIYCAGYRHNMAVPARITELAQEYINSAEAVPA